MQNPCEFREFWEIAKFSFVKFYNVGVVCRANIVTQKWLYHALLRFFKPDQKQGNPFLPNATGPLSVCGSVYDNLDNLQLRIGRRVR